MSLKFHIGPKLAGLISVLIAFAAGLLLLNTESRLGRTLLHNSYDCSFEWDFFGPPDISASPVIIVDIDEASHKPLNQQFNAPWDRTLHAKLLDRLTDEGAKVVVFDIIFSDKGPDPEADRLFADAIQRNGRVILAGDLRYEQTFDPQSGKIIKTDTTTRPYEPFFSASTNWGIASLLPDEDFTIREHFHSVPLGLSSLGWAAAQFLKLPVTQSSPRKERWVKYYGRPEIIPHVSYVRALNTTDVAPGAFRDRIVFIGARPRTGFFDERRDELRSPYRTFLGKYVFMPAVEVQATVFLNLLRQDWLVRLPPFLEWIALLLAATASNYVCMRFRPAAAAYAAIGLAILTFLVAICFFHFAGIWYPWLIVVTIQIPLTLLWAILYKSLDWYFQRRHLEQQRLQAESRIRQQAALLDLARDAIMVHDLDWRAQYWNRSAERLYGWTADEMLNQTLHNQLFSKDHLKQLEARKATLEKNEWTGELHQTTKAGAEIIVESRWTLVRDQIGQPKSILVINTDITEKKKLEAQFLRTQRMESIGTLAGGIAHDLNNVLTPIIMAVELLRLRRLDEDCKKILKTVETSARRGADMVKQVLTFARGHQGERTILQLTHLIKEMEKIISETFPKSIQVGIRLAPNLAPVMGDATQLHQILLNLCVNARDAMPDGGKIMIQADNRILQDADARHILGARPGHYIVLTVSDTGTGIPPEIIDRIFEPFFTTKEVGKGTGLGLSTVLSIVKSHQGFLEVKSDIGKGTSFIVYIPAAEVAPPSTSSNIPPELLIGQGELILVVDDEAPIRDLTNSILTSYGYRALVAADGSEAISLSLQFKGKIAAAMVDMMMPVMDGPTTIRALRKLQPDLKIIVISGLLQLDKAREQINAPDVAFLNKPISADKLLETLRHTLRPKSTLTQPPNPAPELVLSP